MQGQVEKSSVRGNRGQARGPDGQASVLIMSGFPALPLCWTAIAERPRENAMREMLHWQELTGAPLCPSEARMLASKGAIIMAQRYSPDRVELLVRPATKRVAVRTSY
jgi:hypothetical protein